MAFTATGEPAKKRQTLNPPLRPSRPHRNIGRNHQLRRGNAFWLRLKIRPVPLGDSRWSARLGEPMRRDSQLTEHPVFKHPPPVKIVNRRLESIMQVPPQRFAPPD